jgi:hypothetical protein
MVGVKVHGRAVILFFVPFYIPDDANLNCTILSMVFQIIGKIDETNMRAQNTRGSSQGARRSPVDEGHYTSSAPPAGHQYRLARRLWVKLDGVSHNWGRVLFGFFENLIASGVFEDSSVNRGVVGVSH